MHKYLALLYHTKVWLSSNEIKLQKMQILFSPPKNRRPFLFGGTAGGITS